MRISIDRAPVDAISIAEVIDAVLERCEAPAPPGGRAPLTVFSCNVDMVVKASRDPDFAEDMSRGGIVTADGMPVVWLARVLGLASLERVSGADLVPAICAACGDSGRSVYFFGAAPGVAVRAAEKLSKLVPGLKVAGVLSPALGFESRPEELEKTIDEVRAASPDVVFVALGAPRQERFILAHAKNMGAKVLLGIGGALDMAAGDVQRAPLFVQRAGAEWLWRLSHEPKRLWRRYLVEDMAFVRIAGAEIAKMLRAKLG